MRTKVKLSSMNQTMALADALSKRLGAGDTLLLKGPVGAGKTALARSLIQAIQSRAGPVEEVPSPTFTLVQTYEAGALEIWHADLYRLSTVDELYELGLLDAIDDALVLVEWPERMGDLLPSGGLTVHLSADTDDTRELVFEWSDKKWDGMIAATTKALMQND